MCLHSTARAVPRSKAAATSFDAQPTADAAAPHSLVLCLWRGLVVAAAAEAPLSVLTRFSVEAHDVSPWTIVLPGPRSCGPLSRGTFFAPPSILS